MNNYAEYISYITKISLESSQCEGAIERFVSLFSNNNEKIKRVFLIGNGGSASLASHLAQDLNKAAQISLSDSTLNRIQCISLCDNTPFITAIANDEGYKNIFSHQLEAYGFNPKHDVLFAISCSGNSKNVVKAIEKVPAYNRKNIFAMTAFDGGKVKDLIPQENLIHVETHDIYTAESIHTIIHHYIILRLKGFA